jgi:hypothetical protein
MAADGGGAGNFPGLQPWSMLLPLLPPVDPLLLLLLLLSMLLPRWVLLSLLGLSSRQQMMVPAVSVLAVLNLAHHLPSAPQLLPAPLPPPPGGP